MVISKILRLLQLHRPQLRIKSIQAMHIDYGNRPESAEEAAFVMQWSHGESIVMLHSFQFYSSATLYLCRRNVLVVCMIIMFSMAMTTYIYIQVMIKTVPCWAGYIARCAGWTK